MTGGVQGGQRGARWRALAQRCCWTRTHALPGAALNPRCTRAGGVGTVLGLEWAGDIVEVGSAVDGWRAGDRVMGSGGGAYAEFAATHHGRVFPAPPSASYEEAACLPVALQTMHDALVTHGALQRGHQQTKRATR